LGFQGLRLVNLKSFDKLLKGHTEKHPQRIFSYEMGATHVASPQKSLFLNQQKFDVIL